MIKKQKLTFSRSEGSIEPLAASADAIAASTANGSGSDGPLALREEMDSPKSDKEEGIVAGVWEQIKVCEELKYLEVPPPSFKGLWLTQWLVSRHRCRNSAEQQSLFFFHCAGVPAVQRL